MENGYNFEIRILQGLMKVGCIVSIFELLIFTVLVLNSVCEILLTTITSVSPLV